MSTRSAIYHDTPQSWNVLPLQNKYCWNSLLKIECKYYAIMCPKWAESVAILAHMILNYIWLMYFHHNHQYINIIITQFLNCSFIIQDNLINTISATEFEIPQQETGTQLGYYIYWDNIWLLFVDSGCRTYAKLNTYYWEVLVNYSVVNE
jgi:hypothetical protein